MNERAEPKDFRDILGIASNGQYCKKHKGKRYHFGSTAGGWEAALAKYAHDWPFILLGQVPPPMVQDGEALPTTAAYIVPAFVAYQQKRQSRGQVQDVTELRRTVEMFATHIGKNRDMRGLMASDWADIRYALSFKWEKKEERWERTADRIGPASLKRRISYIRTLMRWAGPEGIEKLLPHPNYADQFNVVSDRDVKRAKKLSAKKNGEKQWEVSQIMPIFNGLDEQLQAMFLLSINCGFTAADCSALPWWAVNLDDGRLEFPRKKTGVERMIFLWPETVKALRHVKALNLRPATGSEKEIVHQFKTDGGEPIGEPIRTADLVFLTRQGRVWVYRKQMKDASGVPSYETHKDSIALEFNKVLNVLGIKRKGVGFSAGRSTFETHALRVADKNLVDGFMGHSGGMSDWYDQRLDSDLIKMSREVRARLLPNAEPWKVGGDAPATMRLAV